MKKHSNSYKQYFRVVREIFYRFGKKSKNTFSTWSLAHLCNVEYKFVKIVYFSRLHTFVSVVSDPGCPHFIITLETVKREYINEVISLSNLKLPIPANQ